MTLVVQGGDARIVRGLEGPPGIQGPPSRTDLAIFAQGNIGVRELIFRVELAAPVSWDAAHSALKAMVGATNGSTLSICRNASYAHPLSPADGEIAAALWATGVFSAGAQAGAANGVTTFLGGTPGQAAAGDVLEVWADKNFDPTLAFVSWTLAGA